MDQHSQFVENRNQLYLQLRNSLADNVDFSKPQEKIYTLNTKWKIVQGGVETHSRNLEECYKLLKCFEENSRKMRSWTLESDLSQVRHSYSTRVLVSFLVIEAISNRSSMRRSVSSPDQTPRRELKIRRAAEYF